MCLLVAPPGGALAGHPRGNLGAPLQAHLGQQRSDVVLHRLFRNPELLTDFPIGQPIPDQLKNIAFRGGEIRGGIIVISAPP